MVKKRLDNRVKILIENGASQGYRTFFVLVGDKSRDQVVYLHHMLSKTSLKQANVLWCYKKNLTFSSHRQKRAKQIKAKQRAGLLDIQEEDPFITFVSMTDIRYCYYKETNKILGNTFKMCVLQDFEAITPNMLCRTIETVEGGGLVILLLESLSSLKQLYTLNMDVHSRYRTQSNQHVVPRFNERFILSLATNPACIVMDDQLRILPISSLTRNIQPLPFSASEIKLSANELKLKKMKESTKEVDTLGPLTAICKTLDQANVVTQFLTTITAKNLNSTMTLTAARGRGKSAAMGIALAGAIAFGYSNIFVTSPSPENLLTLFEFVLKGLSSLGYEKHMHYDTTYSSDPDHKQAITRLTVTRNDRQIIQYISPTETDVLHNAELVVIDEAAAIPLPQVKALLGPYLVFLASTISGYEGTGRSLSLKLIQKLREESDLHENARKLVELNLTESIRYKDGDHVEKWLNDLLCLDSSVSSISPTELPAPDECNLYYVNRDTLFGYHKMSEKFLSALMSLLVSSHYRNTPDDLQILSDAPAHHLFVLLPPTSSDTNLPNILCVLQVALEGKISKEAVEAAKVMDGNRRAGDLIPWTVSNLFQDEEFPQLSGARIVRIATHPEAQGKGYGSKSLELLEQYYNISASKASTETVSNVDTTAVTVVEDEQLGLLNETIRPREQPHSLLLSPSEREPEALHYLGVSFGTTPSLLKFWKKSGYSTIYLSKVKNKLTGEYSCLMLKVLGETKLTRQSSWLSPLWFDFRRRFLNLSAGAFKELSCLFAVSLLTNKRYRKKQQDIRNLVPSYLNSSDFKRLELFVKNRCEASLIADVIPKIASLYFMEEIPGCKIKAVKSTILAGLGVQRKIPNVVAAELGIEMQDFRDQFYDLIKEVTQVLKNSDEVTSSPVVDKMTNKRPQAVVQSINNKDDERFLRLMEATQVATKNTSPSNSRKKKLKTENGERKKIKIK